MRITPLLLALALCACKTTQPSQTQQQQITSGELIELTTEQYDSLSNVLNDTIGVFVTFGLYEPRFHDRIWVEQVGQQKFERGFLQSSQRLAISPGTHQLTVWCKIENRDGNEVTLYEQNTHSIELITRIGYRYHLALDHSIHHSEPCLVKVLEMPSNAL